MAFYIFSVVVVIIVVFYYSFRFEGYYIVRSGGIRCRGEGFGVMSFSVFLRVRTDYFGILVAIGVEVYSGEGVYVIRFLRVF